MIVAGLALLFLAALFHIGLLATWLEVLRDLPALDARTRDLAEHDPDALPLVSVIIPARDEEDAIGPCVRGVLAQDWPALEVIVVDDRSTDATPRILAEIAAEDDRLTVLQGRPCPDDWMGKNFALHQGFEKATGDWLLFLDADTTVAPTLVTQTVLEAVEHGTGLLTLIPGNVFRCFWDRVVNAVIFQTAAATQQFDEINDPDHPRANANGPFMLFSRACYDAIGGHAAIPYEVVEDLVLARNVKKAGHSIRWVLAPTLMKLELYESLGDLKRGWGKILQRSMEIDRREVVLNLLSPVFLVALFTLPWLALPASAAWWLALDGGASAALATILAATACVAASATQRFVGHVLEVDDLHPNLQWLGALAVAEMQWEFVARFYLKRQMYWKGRLYHES